MANPISQVERLRQDIERVREEIEWVEKAPLPKDDWKRKVSQWIQASAGDASIQSTALRGLRSGKPDGGFVSENLLAAKSRTRAVSGDAPLVLPVDVRMAPMLCWLLGDEMERRLHAMIDADEYVPGLPLAERPARLMELREELRGLEAEEEAVITAAEDEHVFIGRRADADPAVVLGYVADGDMLVPELQGRIGAPAVPVERPQAFRQGDDLYIP